MNPPETRPSLIVRLAGDRDQLAWTEFVSAYEPFLRRLLVRQGVSERHLSDVSQQVLLAIAQSVERWTDDGRPASFRRWLSRVARNVVIKFMSRERRQVGGQGGSEWLEVLANAPDPAEDRLTKQYEFELLVWAAEQVRPHFRAASWQAFWATVVEGRPVADVAAELHLSPGSIYMSRSRIMAGIREKVREILAE